jgi:hypothetical protein
VVVSERVASSFSRRLVKLASRKNSSGCFDADYRGTGFTVLDGRSALEACLSPVIDVTLAGDVVRRHAIVRQVDDRVVPS